MQNNYEMIRMCILTFGLAGLSWEDMRKQQLHGWAILLLGISGMTISLLGGCWKNPVWFLGLLPVEQHDSSLLSSMLIAC